MFKGRTSTTHVKYYKSLDDIILYNWAKCLEGDVRFIRVEEHETEATESDIKAFEQLYDSYIKQYGLGKLYERYLTQLKKLAISQFSYVEDSVKNKRELNNITFYQSEIDKIKSMMNSGGTTIEDSLIYLSKFIGYNLDSRQITATKYYTTLKAYERANQKK